MINFIYNIIIVINDLYKLYKFILFIEVNNRNYETY